MCHTHLGFNKENIELFRLVPLTHSETEVPPTESEIAVRINNTNLSMHTIEGIMHQKEKHKEQLRKANEALITYLQELQYMKDSYMDILEKHNTKSAETAKAVPASKENSSILEEENSRLHELLQSQINSAESLKTEAKNTFELIEDDDTMFPKVRK